MRRRGIVGPGRPLMLPGGLWIAAASMLLCVWLMTQADRAAWVSSLWCLAAGLIVGVVFARRPV